MSCVKPLTLIKLKSPDGSKNVMKSYRKATPYQKRVGEEIDVPCGKCTSCKIAHANTWANRLSLESEQWKENWFITLTYNEENLPKHNKVDKMTGEVKTISSLKKEDLKKFIKKVRNKYAYKYKHTGIKFFACGEYGEKGKRPHYHLIMFNMPVNDLEHYKNNKKGDKYYKSKEIQEIWGKGIAVITDYTWNTGAYIARYILKKEKQHWLKTSTIYQKLEIIPEYITMSNGIGKWYLEKNLLKILKNDKIIVKSNKKVIITKPFKYYDRILAEKYGYENEMVITKEKRKKDFLNSRQMLAEDPRENLGKIIENIEYYNKQYERKHIKEYENR